MGVEAIIAAAVTAVGSSVVAGSGAHAQSDQFKKGQQKYDEGINRAISEIRGGEEKALGAYEGAQQDLGGLDPYTDAGESALGSYKAALGLPGGTEFNPPESALYKYKSKNLGRDIDRTLAAKGLIGSKAGLRTYEEGYGRLAAEEGESQATRLRNLVGLGYQAQGLRSQLGMNMRGNIADIYTKGAGNIASLMGAQGQQQQATRQSLGNIEQTLGVGNANTMLNMYQNLATSGAFNGQGVKTSGITPSSGGLSDWNMSSSGMQPTKYLAPPAFN